MILLMSRAVVGIATRYTLDDQGIESWRKARFYAPIQAVLRPIRPPVNGYRVSILWAKSPGRGVDHPSPSSTEVKGKVELYL